MFPAGGLFAFSDTEFSNDAKKMMKRFADVFHLAFTRHLDLQQAELRAQKLSSKPHLIEYVPKIASMRTTDHS